jgi:hypothetical protein
VAMLLYNGFFFFLQLQDSFLKWPRLWAMLSSLYTPTNLEKSQSTWCVLGGIMPKFKPTCHLDLEFFHPGLLLGKPRGVDPIYYVNY